MFQGHSSLGAVALRLIEANSKRRLKRETGFTLDQAIETLIWRKKSIATGTNGGTAYIWWWFYLDHGEVAIDYDSGAMPEVNFGNGSYRYVATKGDHFEVQRLVEDWCPQDSYGWHHFCAEDVMLRMGVQPHQKCLSIYSESWSTDYYGESDVDIECELLYVEPHWSEWHFLPVKTDCNFLRPETTMVTPVQRARD